MKITTTLLFLIPFLVLNGQIDTTIYEVDTKIYPTHTISGNLKDIERNSESLKEKRRITIYEPVGFHKDSTYSLIVVSDNQAEALAHVLEPEMLLNQIEDLIIAGIHNREPQKADSILGDIQVDFRTVEMLGSRYVSSENIDLKNTKVLELISNRVPKFHEYIVNEITQYMSDHYLLTERKNWTFGGFSNGGFLAINIGANYPESFGNIISMSPGGDRNGTFNFDFSTTKSQFYICGGTKEKGFYKNSLTIANALKQHNKKFEHKSYYSGHNYNMWLTYYRDCLSRIYKK